MISNTTSTCCDVVIDLDDNSNEDVIILDEDGPSTDVIILDEVGPTTDDVELLSATAEPSHTEDIIVEQLSVKDITDDTSSATNIIIEPSVVESIELESSPMEDRIVDPSPVDENMMEPAFEDDIMIEMSSDEETADASNEDGVVQMSDISKNIIDLPETVAKSSPRENLNESLCKHVQHPANEDSRTEYSNQAIGFDDFKFVCVIYCVSYAGQ